MQTLAVTAVVTRATAGHPGRGDTVTVATPGQAVLWRAPEAGSHPGAVWPPGVQCRRGPELGEVAPAVLGFALGQESEQSRRPELGSTWPNASPHSTPVPVPVPENLQDREAPSHRYCNPGRKEASTKPVRRVNRPRGLRPPPSCSLPHSLFSGAGSQSGHSGHRGLVVPAAGQSHRPGPPQRVGASARCGPHHFPP